MKKKILAISALCAALALSAALVGCSGSSDSSSSSTASSSTEKTAVTIGYWGGTPCELPVYIAKEQGYFEEAGLDVTYVTITSDTSVLLANDQIDCFMATPGDFMALYNGENMKLIDTIHSGCWSGIAISDDIQNCADLSGKKVGTTMMNGPAYTECISLCARQGGDPSTITWVPYTGSTIQAALENGEVDAICGADATSYAIKENLKGSANEAHFFYISAEELGDYECCFIGVNSNTLEEHPEVGDKLAVAFAKADDYINANPQQAIDDSMAKGYADSTYPDVQRQLTINYMFNHGNKDDFTNSIKERWQELYDAGMLTNAPTDESKVDAYLDELTANVSEWHGDAEGAKETANTAGLASLLKARGTAYVN